MVRFHARAALVLLAVLAGCGGGAAGSGPVSAASVLTATPSSVTFSGGQTPVLLTGLRGMPVVTYDPLYVDVAPPVVNGSSATLLVTQVAGGASTITVSDGSGATLAIPVNSLACLPAFPSISLVGQQIVLATPPSPGGPIPPAAFTYLFFATPGTAPAGTFGFVVRLLGSDRSVLAGSPLMTTSTQPGVSTPPSPPPSAAGASYYAAAPPLTAGLTYRVQLVGPRCAPPYVVGSFSS